jgi:hypothetical protein
MEWNKEIEGLKDAENVDYWKPEEGQTIVKFLDEGVFHPFEWQGEIINKVNFRIEVKSKEFIWSVSKGTTFSSLYGQITSIASQRGSLKGSSITLLVKGQKLARQYIIMESLDLHKPVKQEKVSR